MQGIIIKGISSFYYVKIGDSIYECKARGKFRFDELTPMIGDNVEVNIKNGKGYIEKIYERLNCLVRPAVANVTQAFIVFSVKNPEINLNLLNKLMLLCDYNKLHVVICFSKIDIDENFVNSDIADMVIKTGYDVVFINAKTGYGVSKLKDMLAKNVTVFCGPSGVGKSTLINQLKGKNIMETGDISEKVNRGKHTTRHCQLIEVDSGFILDTPGFSSIATDFINKEDLQYHFPEFKNYIGKCRFNGCAHYKEPDCSVKKAVECGEINKARYDFYINILEECLDRRIKR